MAELRTLVEKVRSKNAGPFWLTIDIFCGHEAAYHRVADNLSVVQIAGLFQINSNQVKKFEIPSLRVVKFSLPRPTVQGSIHDRDMHGASWAALVGEMEIP